MASFSRNTQLARARFGNLHKAIMRLSKCLREQTNRDDRDISRTRLLRRRRLQAAPPTRETTMSGRSCG